MRIGCGSERSADHGQRWARRRCTLRRSACASPGCGLRLVVLVADVAHELLEQVLEGHEADHRAIGLAHQRQVQLRPQHAREQLVAVRLGEGERQATPAEGSVGGEGLDEVEDVHHAHRRVQRALEDRARGCSRTARPARAISSRRQRRIDGEDIGARRHDVGGGLVAELHDAADDRGLVARADALELALAQQFVQRVAVLLGGRPRDGRGAAEREAARRHGDRAEDDVHQPQHGHEHRNERHRPAARDGAWQQLAEEQQRDGGDEHARGTRHRSAGPEARRSRGR